MQTVTPLMPHQQTAVAKVLPTKVAALFMDMGTGKGRTVMELAKIRQGKFDLLFWFCPVSLKETIQQEWYKHTDLPVEQIKIWDERVSVEQLPTEARVHIIGIESMSSSSRLILAYQAMVTDQSFVVVDESTYIKGHSSLRTQRITELSRICRYRLILTGTPFTQGAVDLFAQMYFLSPKILGYTSFYSFAANHLEYEMKANAWGHLASTGRIIRSHNTEYLAAKIAPYIYQVKKEECLDLPDKLYETRYFRLTDEQWSAYEQAKQEILDVDFDDWDSLTIFRLFTALQAIVCGFWTRTDPNTQQVQHLTFSHRRVELLLSILANIPEHEPVIVWGKYHHAIDEIKQACKQQKISFAEFHGGLKAHQRNSELTRWRRGETRLLIATQSAGGHGLTLNESSYSIFYADSYKYSERQQAEDRNHRIGQSRRPTYISLCCAGTIDERIARSLARKENALASFQCSIDRCRKEALKAQAIQLVKSL